MFLLHTKIEVQSRTKYYYIKIQIPQPRSRYDLFKVHQM